MTRGMLFCLIVLRMAAAAAAAQTTTGTISGVARDASGAVLPGVTVTVKNVETGATRVLATETDGRYLSARARLSR